ncbi:hypothetical protein ACWN8V_12520 [Vagococcus elongatus]|uniref:Uncharacterized protein n=1 Tax=Vagococcus elongatus TaxID=180344 RepID=A0A430ALZ0_9ENTE|nr:hypothetical protein [Vagococcus elongatus]RSU09086.1 hypothetical protein CBF29_12390 [Vagococcus elongatus]
MSIFLWNLTGDVQEIYNISIIYFIITIIGGSFCFSKSKGKYLEEIQVNKIIKMLLQYMVASN